MKHRALVIGAGRIGAGYKWHDDAYTHAGAYRALSDRVELVGFVEPDLERRVAANLKWKVPTYDNVYVALEALKPDIVSVCVQPEKQREAFIDKHWGGVRAIWCEKPFMLNDPGIKWVIPIQVNYMRRGDPFHRAIKHGGKLTVYGKDDIHTKCHFEDLAKFWEATLVYRAFNGPCAYVYEFMGQTCFFDNGGVDGATCFKAMLGNLIDHIEGKADLWSPPS